MARAKYTYSTTEIVTIKQVVREVETKYPKMNTGSNLKDFATELIADEAQEVLLLICLDNQLEMASFSVVHRGTVNNSLAVPRDVFQRALLANAKGIILAHNHPSGHANPSKTDDDFTEKIVDAGKILGIQVLDHMIVTRHDYFSYKERGVIL